MCNLQFIYTMHAFSIYYFVYTYLFNYTERLCVQERIAPVTSFALAMARSLFLLWHVLVRIFLPNPQPLFSAASWSVWECTLFSHPDAGGALLKSTLFASIVFIWHKIHSCINWSSVIMHVHHVLSVHKQVHYLHTTHYYSSTTTSLLSRSH